LAGLQSFLESPLPPEEADTSDCSMTCSFLLMGMVEAASLLPGALPALLEGVGRCHCCLGDEGAVAVAVEESSWYEREGWFMGD
jgi:hypothetical protein